MQLTKAMRAWLEVWLLGKAVPTEATMSWHTAMPMAPNIKSGRRPHFSTRIRPGMVLHTLTTSVITEMMKGLLMPELWNFVKDQ